MALTSSEVAKPPTNESEPDSTQTDKPGWIRRWARADPVRTAAVALIVVQLAWRADIASRGFLAEDDFVIAGRAAGSDLTPDFLFSHVNNHFAPAVMFITWLMVRLAGLSYWPYLLLLLAGQAAVSVGFYRLLRRLVRPGWGLLIPLCVFLFTPLTLDLTAFWFTGALILPMQLAMVLAIGAQVKYVRTGHPRHLATLALSVVFGLLFFEKSLLIVPLAFLVTACLLVRGRFLSTIVRTIRLYWPSWLVLTAVSAIYLAIYQTAGESSLRVPPSIGHILIFARDLIGGTLIPGLFGGPWRWHDAGDGAPISGTEDLARWLAWALLLAIVAATVWLRTTAGRAWVLLLAYSALAVGLVAATRIDGLAYSDVAGLVPRYVSDVVIVAAICIGVAMFGIADAADTTREPRRALPSALQYPEAMAIGLILALVGLASLGVGALLSGARFSENWSVKNGRDYLHVAQAELAQAPRGTVFFDQPVPNVVVPGVSWPYNLQSYFFRPLEQGPIFVTEAENPSMFDQAGHIHPVRIDGPSTLPGSVSGCGHKLSDGIEARMPLNSQLYAWNWYVRIGYLSSGDSAAVFEYGNATHQLEIEPGLHQIFFPVVGGGDAVYLTVNNPAVTVCVDQITVGNLAPQAKRQ